MLCGGFEGIRRKSTRRTGISRTNLLNNALDPATEEPSQQRAGPSEAAIDPWTPEPSGLREPTGCQQGRGRRAQRSACSYLQLLAADAADDLAGLVPSALSSPCLSDIPVKRRITQKSDEAMESEFDTEAANPEKRVKITESTPVVYGGSQGSDMQTTTGLPTPWEPMDHELDGVVCVLCCVVLCCVVLCCVVLCCVVLCVCVPCRAVM